MALIIDSPGGPFDRLAHDPDVATFLNDRFEPRFATPAEVGRTAGGTLLLTPSGCLLTASIVAAETPAAWIAAVNEAVAAPLDAPRPPSLDRVPGVGPEHPLGRPCERKLPTAAP